MWPDYYKKTKSLPPSPLLIKALPFVQNHGKAIDIGAGALKDTRFLLEQGFDVTAIDKEDLMAQEAEGISSNKFHLKVTSFADFDFPKSEYDLASSMFALPFNPPETFTEVFEKVKKSLAPEGIFCGNLFGDRDEWASIPERTFHARAQVEALLQGLEIIEFEEKEWDGKLASGTPKHWHTFNIIARKKG